jgi:CheY-like chemotaxis protein
VVPLDLKPPAKKNILLVDDDCAFVESLADVLRLDGHAVDAVTCSEEAVKRFAVSSYDLTFLDFQLPGMSGLATILALRQIDPEAPMYLITGHSIEFLLDMEIARGRWRRLKDPIDAEYLQGALQQVKPAGLLLADGEPSSADHLRTLLDNLGIRADIARSRRDAFAGAADGKREALILDLRSTLLAGLEIYAELRQHRQLVPIILCSAYAFEETDSDDIERLLEITGILTKPFSPKLLHKAVERMVNKPFEALCKRTIADGK